jgi:hypothetical protein
MLDEPKRERHRRYRRERYQNDPAFRARHHEQVRLTRHRQRAAAREVVEQAKGPGCSVCGERDPVCLDFHHVSGSKDFSLGDVMRGRYSVERIKAELRKCIVVCANCHRKLHAYGPNRERGRRVAA